MTDIKSITTSFNPLLYVVLPIMGTLVVVAILIIVWYTFTYTAADRRALRLIFMMDSSAADLDEELLLGGEEENDYPQTRVKKKAEAGRAGLEKQADIVDCHLEQATATDEEVKTERFFMSHGRAPARFKSKTRVQRIAIALAGECYFKFGRRPKSEANVLISRKWLRDRMEEVKDFRKKDAASVIDIALGLSFYPSVEAREMDEHLSTAVSASRMAQVSDSWWCRLKARLEISAAVSTTGFEPVP